jgi:hypothetical protein
MTCSRDSLVLALAFLTTLACTSHDAEHHAQTAPAAAVVPPASAAPAAARAPEAPAPAKTPPAHSGALTFTAQPGWMVETPTSSMRKAQYRLPGSDGAADAVLVVYHFGAGGGGGVEANLERWAGQFEQPDGSDSRATMRTSTRNLNGMDVTEVDLAGTYVAETSPGSGEHVREEGWRMLAAILPAPEGAYYAKLVGPAVTIARWQASFESFLEGVGR